MGLWTESQIEAWISPETRIVEMPTGALEPLTLSALVWQYYDELLDLGYMHGQLLQTAQLWEPERWPLDLRFAWTIQDYRDEHRKRWGE